MALFVSHVRKINRNHCRLHGKMRIIGRTYGRERTSILGTRNVSVSFQVKCYVEDSTSDKMSV